MVYVSTFIININKKCPGGQFSLGLFNLKKEGKMEITGIVQDIIYKNETNGYLIAVFQTEQIET